MVEVGDSREKVVSTMGRPTGTVSDGRNDTLWFSNCTVRLTDGKVVSAEWRSAEGVRSQPQPGQAAPAGSNESKTATSAPSKTDPFVEELIEKAEGFRRQGKLDEARAQYKEIESFFLEYAPDAAVRVGDILLLQGKTDLAIQAYQDALRKYPRGATRCGAVDKLNRLKAEPNHMPVVEK